MKTYRVLLWALALVGLGADQASKYAVFAWLAPVDHHIHWLFQTGPHTGFALETRYEYTSDGALVPGVNQGALFGLGREHATFANWTFAVVSLLAAAAIVSWSFRPSAARDLWVCLALGLILAGTLGNLYDRVLFDGVRDFLHWNYLFDWPVFNIADSCLVCGAVSAAAPGLRPLSRRCQGRDDGRRRDLGPAERRRRPEVRAGFLRRRGADDEGIRPFFKTSPKRQRGFPSNPSLALRAGCAIALVPKLGLGTRVCETLFRVPFRGQTRSGASRPCVPKPSLGTRETRETSPKRQRGFRQNPSLALRAGFAISFRFPASPR